MILLIIFATGHIMFKRLGGGVNGFLNNVKKSLDRFFPQNLPNGKRKKMKIFGERKHITQVRYAFGNC